MLSGVSQRGTNAFEISYSFREGSGFPLQIECNTCHNEHQLHRPDGSPHPGGGAGAGSAAGAAAAGFVPAAGVAGAGCAVRGEIRPAATMPTLSTSIR